MKTYFVYSLIDNDIDMNDKDTLLKIKTDWSVTRLFLRSFSTQEDCVIHYILKDIRGFQSFPEEKEIEKKKKKKKKKKKNLCRFA